MAQRVADEVGEDNVEATAVQPCGQPSRNGTAHTGPATRSQALADGVRDISFVGDKLYGAGIEAGDLDEVFDQPVEVLNLLSVAWGPPPWERSVCRGRKESPGAGSSGRSAWGRAEATG